MWYEFEQWGPEENFLQPKKLSEQPTVHPEALIHWSKLGSWTDIGVRSQIIESEIGDYTYLAGDNSVIYARIGKFCSIASHVRINPGNHPMHRVMQHHCTYRRVQYGLDIQDDQEFFGWRKAHEVEIGHDVWLGHAAVVLAGVKIGTGAVIGAGAIVTRDIPPYAIAVGVPAQVIKHRFDPAVRAQILQTQWWEWERAMLEERFADFRDVGTFIQKYGVERGGAR